MDQETLYAVACQFLEMLKADLFLKALSVADFQPTMALLETRLAVGGHHRLLPGTPVAAPRAGLSDAPFRRRAAAPGPADR